MDIFIVPKKVPWSWLSRKSTQIFLHCFPLMQIFVASICPEISSNHVCWCLLFTNVRISIDMSLKILSPPKAPSVSTLSTLSTLSAHRLLLEPVANMSLGGRPKIFVMQRSWSYSHWPQLTRLTPRLLIKFRWRWTSSLLLDVAGLQSVHDYSWLLVSILVSVVSSISMFAPWIPNVYSWLRNKKTKPINIIVERTRYVGLSENRVYSQL